MLTVGVDIAKATLEAAAWQDGHGLRLGTFAQTLEGWSALRDVVVGLQRPQAAPSLDTGHLHADREGVALVLEPTGGYELAFALWARQQPDWQVHRPNPARVRAWARSQGLRAKTDQQDALLLARFGASAQPALPIWQPLASEVSELDQLLRRRDDVTDWLQRERRRAEQLAVRPDASGTVRASVERLLKMLEDELADLEQAIASPSRAGAAPCRLARGPGTLAHRAGGGQPRRAPTARWPANATTRWRASTRRPKGWSPTSAWTPSRMRVAPASTTAP